MYIGGGFFNTVDFDPGAGLDNRTSAGSYDAFLSKYDSSGRYQWTNVYGGIGDDSDYLVVVDKKVMCTWLVFLQTR